MLKKNFYGCVTYTGWIVKLIINRWQYKVLEEVVFVSFFFFIFKNVLVIGSEEKKQLVA